MWDFEEILWKLLILSLGVICIMAFIAIFHHSAERDRLVKQCMEDDKKEYECKAMFRDDTTYVPMPIPIVVPR